MNIFGRWLALSIRLIVLALSWIMGVISFSFNFINISPYIIISAVVLTIAYLTSEFLIQKEDLPKLPHISKTNDKLNKYLYNLINTEDRLVIFTRDFSWANSTKEIYEKLKSKSNNGELIICLAKETVFTSEFGVLGADVYLHNLTESQLKSRFILIGYGKSDYKINVGNIDAKNRKINKLYNSNTSKTECQAFAELFELVKSNSDKIEKVNI